MEFLRVLFDFKAQIMLFSFQVKLPDLHSVWMNECGDYIIWWIVVLNFSNSISVNSLYHWWTHQLVLIVEYFGTAMSRLQCIALADTSLHAWVCLSSVFFPILEIHLWDTISFLTLVACLIMWIACSDSLILNVSSLLHLFVLLRFLCRFRKAAIMMKMEILNFHFIDLLLTG